MRSWWRRFPLSHITRTKVRALHQKFCCRQIEICRYACKAVLDKRANLLGLHYFISVVCMVGGNSLFLQVFLVFRSLKPNQCSSAPLNRHRKYLRDSGGSWCCSWPSKCHVMMCDSRSSLSNPMWAQSPWLGTIPATPENCDGAPLNSRNISRGFLSSSYRHKSSRWWRVASSS